MKKVLLVLSLFLSACTRQNPAEKVEINFDDNIVLAEDWGYNHYFIGAIHKLPVDSLLSDIPDGELQEWSTCDDSIMLKIVRDGTVNLIELCPYVTDNSSES